MPILKPLEPLEQGLTIDEIRTKLSNSGILNGSFVAVKIAEAVLTGDSEKLLRKGRNIDSICDYPADQVTQVYNEVVAEINTRKGVIKDNATIAFKVLLVVLKKFNIKLPFGIK
jgi:hypothetical protein